MFQLANILLSTLISVFEDRGKGVETGTLLLKAIAVPWRRGRGIGW